MSSVLIDQHSISCSTGTCPRGRAACCRAETRRATRAARRATTPARPSPPPPSSPSSVSTALCCAVYCVYVCVSECVCNSAHHTCDLSRNNVFGALAGRPHVRLLHIRSIMHIIDIFWRVLSVSACVVCVSGLPAQNPNPSWLVGRAIVFESSVIIILSIHRVFYNFIHISDEPENITVSPDKVSVTENEIPAKVVCSAK